MRFFLIIIVGFYSASGWAAGYADAGSYTPNVIARWVKSSGGQVAQYGALSKRWAWLPPSPGFPDGAPVLRVTLGVRIPKTWTYRKASGENAKLMRIQKIGSSNDGAHQLTIDVVASSAALDLTFADGKHSRELSLALVAEYRDPFIIRHKDCPNYDIWLQPENRAGRHLFLGWSCDETDKKLVVYVTHSADAKWAGKTAEREGERPSLQYTISKLQDSPEYGKSLVKITTTDSHGRLITYSLSYSPRQAASRWTITPGLAATFLSYQETLLRIAIKELGSTGKISIGYKIIPPRWTLDLTAFMTLAIFTISPAGTPTAKVLGINGRAGYRLPIDTWGMNWTLSGGVYYWSMAVERDAYGVKPLIGPQLYLTVGRGGDSRDRALYAYLKLASISDGSSLFSFSDREVAIGGGIGLTVDPHPFVATLDISQTAFARRINSMSMEAVSLGLGKRF